MWSVYILRCKDGSLYTGITTDIDRRLREHLDGKGGRYTRSFKVDSLVYSESYVSRQDAQRREKQIKGWRRQKKNNLIR